MKLLFVSRNRFKHAEATHFLSTLGIDVEASNFEIHELQTVDTEALVKDKAERAFAALGRPLFVEHTGLYLNALNGFPLLERTASTVLPANYKQVEGSI